MKREFVNGQVYELRSASKHYPAPCALVLNSTCKHRSGRAVVAVDRCGVIGDGFYARSHNPGIHVSSFSLEDLRKRIVRRRRDLERFDCFDLDLIRYGYALDFSGLIHGGVSSIPLTRPADWTVFWTPPYAKDEFYYSPHGEINPLLAGAWHFHTHGGPRHLGYKFGHLWSTRHGGRALRQIRDCLRSFRGDLIEQACRVVRWQSGEKVFTSELRRDCPALGSGSGSRVTTYEGPGPFSSGILVHG